MLRFVGNGFNICQCLVRICVLAKSFKGQELAREIVSILSTELQCSGEKFIAATRNDASVNGTAVGFLDEVVHPIERT